MNNQLPMYFELMKSPLPWAPAEGSKGKPSLSPGKPPKKNFERKKCTNKILPCKRSPSYVMRGIFLTKGPHVMR